MSRDYRSIDPGLFTPALFDAAEAERSGYARYSYWRSTMRTFFKSPVAVALIEGVAHLVDGEGYVIGLTGSGADDLPVITGLGGRDGAALAAALDRGVSMLERLNVHAPLFAARLSELDLADPSNIVVYTLDGGPRLLLDPERVERNVNRWLELGRTIENRAGALDYVDLRWSKRIAVKPLRP